MTTGPTDVALLVPPLHGHVNPALGTAAELARCGHRVQVHLPERFRESVERAGARLVAHPDPPEPPWARGLDRLSRFSSMPARLAEHARVVLPATLDVLATDPPDVLVHDHLGVFGRLAAAVVGRPGVQLCTSYAAGPRWSPHYPHLPDVPGAADAWDTALDELAGTCGTPRLGQTEFLAGSTDPTVVFVPRVLHPAAATYGDRYTFVGPALPRRPPSGRPDLDDLQLDDLQLDDEQPLAYVSMGTLFADWPALTPLCDAAFADDRWQVVLSSPGTPAERRGSLRIRPRVPQLAVLDRATVAVTHAGMGTVCEALHAGVPLVVIPQVPEQEITAARLAALGVAIQLHRDEATPATLRDAIDHVAHDSGVRHAVGRLRHSVQSAGGASAAARAVLDAYQT